jgi:hypothetical protein
LTQIGKSERSVLGRVKLDGRSSGLGSGRHVGQFAEQAFAVVRVLVLARGQVPDEQIEETDGQEDEMDCKGDVVLFDLGERGCLISGFWWMSF